MNKKVIVMQKVQNVNSKVLFILAVTFCSSLHSQINLEGVFCKVYSLEGVFSKCLTFEGKKNFKYKYGGHLGTDFYGQGEYKIIDKKLILHYNKTEPQKTGYHVSKIWTNNKDSINVNFKFFDFDSIPLPAANVVYKDSLSKYGLSGLAANEKGIAVFNLKKDRTNLQFIITNLGFKQYELLIEKNYNYDISVYLQKDGSGLPILNQIDTLNIVKMKRKYFEVRNKNGSITKWKRMIDN